MKNLKLTPKQKEMYNFVCEQTKKDGYGYVECGKWKPFDQKVFEALMEKGLVKHEDKTDIVYGAYCLIPTK